jgi:hypothetical protein
VIRTDSNADILAPGQVDTAAIEFNEEVDQAFNGQHEEITDKVFMLSAS